MPRSRRSSIDAAWLRKNPLPFPDHGGDKEERGRVLVVGGSREMAGAAVLAATAALRAGAGKLQIATAASVAPHVGIAIPEARVYAIPEAKDGSFAARGAAAIAKVAASVQAVIVGPGMIGDAGPFLAALVPKLRTCAVVYDAEALTWIGEHRPKLGARAVLTPHAGEMASMLGMEKKDVERGRPAIARDAAKELGAAVVALKGAVTHVASIDDGAILENRAGNVGLATSGSGDTLGGIVAGLLARGASPLLATAWAVHLHASAGDALAKKHGALGFLARELLDEIPRLLEIRSAARR